jgi:hypothetical protein
MNWTEVLSTSAEPSALFREDYEPPTGRRIGRVMHEFCRPKYTITMALISNIRMWVEPYLGPSTLIIEREHGKTRIALRFTGESRISEIEAADLLLIKRKSLPAAAIYAALMEARQFV